MSGKKFFLGTWFAVIGVIFYESLHNGKGIPPPAQLIKACMVWTILAILAEANAKLAATLGLGFTVALLIQPQYQSMLGFGTPSPGSNAAPAVGNVASGISPGSGPATTPKASTTTASQLGA